MKSKEKQIYIDLGGPGTGGFWIAESEYFKKTTVKVNAEWRNKSGEEVIEDIKQALDEK